MTDWFGFSVAVLLIELTPGPNMAWLVALTLGEGKRAGLAAVAGIAVGLLANGSAAAAGMAALISAAPWTLTALRYAGVATLLALAVLTWRDRPLSTTIPASVNDDLRANFVAGLLLNLFNPKALLFFMVVAPRFLGERADTAAALSLVAISVTIATFIHACLVVAAAGASGWLRQESRVRTVRRFLAVAIVGVAAWTAS